MINETDPIPLHKLPSYFFRPFLMPQFLHVQHNMLYLRSIITELLLSEYKDYYLSTKDLMHVLPEQNYNLLATGKDEKFIFPIFTSKLKEAKNKKFSVAQNQVYKPNAQRRKYHDEFRSYYKECGIYLEDSILKFNRDNDLRVDYMNWLNFALVFIYYDGRDFKNNRVKTIDGTPRTKKHVSPFSYKLVLEQTLKLFSEKDDNMRKLINIDFEPHISQNQDLLYNLVQLLWIDKTFKFFKINRMVEVKNKFLSDENLDFICKEFRLQYREIVNLKNTFNTTVFENEDFIKSCLKEDYYDPLIVFQEFFKKYIRSYSFTSKDPLYNMFHIEKNFPFEDIGLPFNRVSLHNIIAHCKKKTIEFIEYASKYAMALHSSDGGNLKFTYTFFYKYFYKNRAPLENYLSSYIDCYSSDDDDLLKPKELRDKKQDYSIADDTTKYIALLSRIARKTIPKFDMT